MKSEKKTDRVEPGGKIGKIEHASGAVSMTDEEREARLLSTAGFAARGRMTVFGTGLICESLRKGSVHLVLEAADTSDNTHKRLSDKCAFYGVRLCRLSVNAERLALAFGKRDERLAAVGITDSGIIRALMKYLPEEN